MADQWHIRLTKCGAGFILRFVVPELSFLKWKQVYAQISPKEIWKAFMWGNERSAAYFWRIKGKLLGGKKKNGNGRFRVQTTLAPTRWHVHTPLFVRTGPLRCAQVAIYSYGRRCTQMAIRTQTLTYVHILRPWRTRRWKALLFFYEQIAVLCWRVRLHLHIRTHVRASTNAHGVNARRRSHWVNVSAAMPAVAALIIFIYAFSNTEGERERERWERLGSNYCYVFTRRHPAGFHSPGLVTPRFLVQIQRRICLFVVDAYAHQRITSIKSSAYLLFVCPCIFFFFFLLLLKDRRILDCVCGWGMESVFALSQLSDPKIMIVSESPSKGTIQWSRLPQEIKAPSLLPCAFTPNSLHHRHLIFISSWHWEY